MQLTLFRSTKDSDIFGFTAEPTGSNLPAELVLGRKLARALRLRRTREAAVRGLRYSIQ